MSSKHRKQRVGRNTDGPRYNKVPHGVGRQMTNSAHASGNRVFCVRLGAWSVACCISDGENSAGGLNSIYLMGQKRKSRQDCLVWLRLVIPLGFFWPFGTRRIGFCEISSLLFLRQMRHFQNMANCRVKLAVRRERESGIFK